MKNFMFRLQAMCIALLLGVATMSAQEIRYVKMTGDNTKNGQSWANAKKDIQAAINDLVNSNKTGEVWVAEGTYYPTETTESGSQYYKSFKIPAGITVRGGFAGTETYTNDPKEALVKRQIKSDKNFGNVDNDGKSVKTGNLDGEAAGSGVYVHKTVLSGDLYEGKTAKFSWNPNKQQFDVTFYGNSYHVVWFAMNGFSASGRANPLSAPAKLEGCVVEDGHAYTSDAIKEHPHAGYGGGIYMVANSFVYNCEVRHCDASRNGGGIYMDGGGIVRRTYVHDCQALGLGTEFGLGGGICEDGAAHNNSQTNPVVVAQSAVTNCVGRMGGGMALVADQTIDKAKYSVVVNSTLVNNNTAQIEAGGVYTYKGGGIASATIVNNKCCGSGITQNGVITGRSGGLYSRDAAYVGNTVIWGNECEANKDMQFATSRSSLSETEKTKFFYNALSNADLADWSATEKMGVLSLENINNDPNTSDPNYGGRGKKGYTLFRQPAVDPETHKNAAGYYKNYLTCDGVDEEGNPVTATIDWTVSSESMLTYAGINTADLDMEKLTPAPKGISYDMQFGVFNSRPTIGAFVSEIVDIAPKDKDNAERVKDEYFVDPEFVYTKNNPDDNGVSWDRPARFLGNVLDHIKRHSSTKDIIIHVKEGVVDNTCVEIDKEEQIRVRNTSLDIPSNVTIIGSYSASLTGTDISKRNAVLTPTVISGKLMNDYKYNVAHLININNKENITIDGFKLSFANSVSQALAGVSQNGAAIVLTNCEKLDEDVDPNIHFKNITVSNCYGDKGTAVYADNASADFENCIFHNNTTATLANSGLVYGINASDLRFDHCDVVRNVGHASYLGGETHNIWTNSIFYGNMDRYMPDTNLDAGGGIGFALAAFSGNTTQATGSRCMFDSKSASFALQFGGNDTGNQWQYNLQYAFVEGVGQGYPRFINPTKNAGYSVDGDATYYGRSVSYEPHNNNPVVNAAGTAGEPHAARQWGKDITTVITRDFGGLPDIGAVESHISTVDDEPYENANHDGQMPYGVAYYVRDYAQPGMPLTYVRTENPETHEVTYTEQTGANLGKGNYVDENGTKIFLDGASWQYAVSGNADYGVGVVTTRDVNTKWKAVQGPGTSTFSGKFTISITVNGTTRYLYNSGSTNSPSLGTTDDPTRALEWKVGTVSTAEASLAGSNQVYATIGTRNYFLGMNNNNPRISTTQASCFMAGSDHNYTIRLGSSTARFLRYNNSLTTTTSTTASGRTWTFTPVDDVTPGAWSEENVAPQGKTTYDRTSITSSTRTISEPLDIHAYTSVQDITNLGADAIVTYKIKLAGSGLYAYDYSTYYHYIRTNGTGDTFALIASNVEDQYYLYDITTSRYVVNNSSSTSPIRTGTTPVLWRITKDASNSNSFNITLASQTLTDNLPGWSNNGSGTNVTNVARNTNANQEWVLVAQKDYTNKYYKEEQRTAPQLNGLQYAVNTVHEEFVSGGKQHEVHVAQGTYTNTTDADANSVSQPYAYMMKEGVDVLGGYPTVGNPGEDQRQPKQFETILQPQTESPYVKMTFKLADSNAPTVSSKKIDMYVVSDANDGKDWGSCARRNNADDLASKGRVLVQPTDFSVSTSWDGFTMRYGYLNTAYMNNIGVGLNNLQADKVKTAGGAGVLLQGNGALINCEVVENLILCVPRNNTNMTKTGEHTTTPVEHDLYTYHIGGAGVFMTGSGGTTATVENCEIGKNQALTKAIHIDESVTSPYPDNLWMYGAGLYQNGGNVYNTIIHDNIAATIMGSTISKMNTNTRYNNEMVLGAGAFIVKGNFYNNTIVKNESATLFHCHNNHCTFAGVHVFNEAYVYNSIIADNTSHWAYENPNMSPAWGGTNPGGGIPVSAFALDNTDRFSRDDSRVHVFYSFVDVRKHATHTTTDDRTTPSKEITIPADLVSTNDLKNTNIYLNYGQGKAYEEGVQPEDIYPTSKVYYKPGESGTTEENIYRLKSGSPCINTGTEDIDNVTIPDFDAGYDDRIQDCKIDIGAYESNGKANIGYQTSGNQLVFYVTPEGKGATTGDSPKNAACAQKLQMVLDAASRAKVANPDKQVIVKVANSYDMLHPADPADATNFTYYATRTTDASDQDVRMWSIMVPRGVEVWGGYTDVAASEVAKEPSARTWTDAVNGFVDGTGKDLRNITANPTYFDSYYYNKEQKSNATTYHVVTFTDRVYDVNGVPFLKKDIFNVDSEGKVTGLRTDINLTTTTSKATLNDTDESLFAHMSDIVGTGNVKNIGGNFVSNRAVLDGIFITGGNADGKMISGSTSLNANSYGGAAIVTDYAYVRNCIVKDNSATNGGGLALTNGALVSGSLIIENNASNDGGGLYVFENGATLSNGITIDSKAPEGQAMDYNMAHVLTTTIVGNKAQQGGGVWYSASSNDEANARFNSVAIWQNSATDQANVYGMVNPEQPTEDETVADVFYPFAYSLIQNVRASGTNNMSVDNLNSQGVRFIDADNDINKGGSYDKYQMAEEIDDPDLSVKLSDFGYYGLTSYSLLCSNGMPVDMYTKLKSSIAIADNDILGTSRITSGNKFVEIGARALAKEMPTAKLMLRLFVAHPEHVEVGMATRFMRLSQKASKSDVESYYSQMGSSFAYPFNSLQDALDYVKMARNGEIITGNTESKDLPFEILVGKGEWYPKKDLNGGTVSVWSQTFAIPEGVTIIGGFNPVGGVVGEETTYYGRYYQVGTANDDIYQSVDPIPSKDGKGTSHQATTGRKNWYGSETLDLPAVAEVKDAQGHVTTAAMPAVRIKFQQWHIQDIADRRAMNDNNKNGVVEPWEFFNQTIISGNAVNGETDGVYHVMTAVADANAVGNMPRVKSTNGDWAETGYQWKEEGQQIRLNGLIITGGNALTYLNTALDEYGRNIFYQGAGLQVDGNRYSTSTDDNVAPTFYNPQTYGVGYRDIPVSITNCQFRNNIAGYGGAISTNGSLSIFGSSFEQNVAVADTEKGPFVDENNNPITGITDNKVMYPGQGGAILATRQLSAFNTLFANNEARWDDESMAPTIELVKHSSFRVPNKENATPTLRAAGGAIMMGNAAVHHIVNCDFVRNKANAYPAVFTMNPTVAQDPNDVDTHNYSQIINTVAWGNEVNEISENSYYKTAAKLLVNIGKKGRDTGYISDTNNKNFYVPTFEEGNVPDEDDLKVANPEAGDDDTWQEAVWFCAYEQGVGFTPNNALDLRDAIVYTPGKYAPEMIETAAKTVKGGDAALNTYYQNCNQLIVADNGDVAGPNFRYPSVKAGYDGFMEGADWSPARLNRLTDNGNGWIKQTVDPATLNVTFNNEQDVTDSYQGAYPVTHYLTSVFPEYKLWLALGNEKYMQATSDKQTESITINDVTLTNQKMNLPRISPDPTKGVQKAYIDIGVYEYIKQPLLKPGSEVDILWVSTKENPSEGPANGLTWKTPTSDLQRAIETLLQSRNGHKKEIRIMEGEYTPVQPKTIGTTKYNAFVIDTKSLNESAIAPSSFETDSKSEKYYAQSITIKGGYSSEIPYEYDPVKYKTTIRQEDTPAGVNTDYLIYIADPTLRYYYPEKEVEGVKQSGYKPGTADGGNMDGAIVSGAADDAAKYVKTMPIQVDGVTLINDKASAGTKGSAIYYPNVDIEDAHSVNVGGKVKYYMDKEHTIPSPNNAETDYAVITDDPGILPVQHTKLLITKTEIIGSGKQGDQIALDSENPATEKAPSAVYIGEKGGGALIYNTVFHSNYGLPLDAWNTINVNNTFGKNDGLVRLRDAADVEYVKSQMHNSALWKNNKGGDQFIIPRVSVDANGDVKIKDANPSQPANFTYNSFTGGNVLLTAETGDGTGKNYYNTGLVDKNDDLASGPNFVDPENADIYARNFDIKPSVRLLNKGNGKRWQVEEQVQDPAFPDDPSKKITVLVDKYEGTYNDLVITNKYDFSLASTTDKDVLNRTRIVSNADADGKQRIDIGAYEFQGSLLSILYVDPNKSHSDEATGENWDKAFGYGDLQDAVDLAAISHMTNTDEEAYVFVKGNSSTSEGMNTNETLTLRNGVTVYGSIGSSYEDWHAIDDPDNPGHPKYNSIKEYIDDLTSQREGVASNAASKTIVTGIQTSEFTDFKGVIKDNEGHVTKTIPALVDGFVVTNPDPTEPVVKLVNPSEDAVIVVRNVVVADNDLKNAAGTNVNVAEVSNGLIYEVLMRDNKAKGNGVVLKVGNVTVPDASASGSHKTRGFAVNVTVEGKTIGADNSTPVDGGANYAAEKAAQIFNSITNSITVPGASASGAYGNIKNKGISGFFYNIADPNLNYQLTETSKYIDMCDGTKNPLSGVEGAANLVQFINYDTDRDILGNPRLLAGVTDGKNGDNANLLDRGAFETWKIDSRKVVDEVLKVNEVKKQFFCGETGTISKNSDYNTTGHEIIKKHFYPHDGSVVYIMEGNDLIIDAYDPSHEVKATAHNPGFMLVQDGANFYGNGRPATCAFLAIERKVRKGGSVVAVPYAMKYNKGVDIPSVDTNRELVLTNTSGAAYEYSGSQRSAWDYIFAPENSTCWKAVADDAATAANTGVLYVAKDNVFTGAGNETERLLRFTAQGANLTDYLYTETTDAYKSVTLTQNDDAESTGNGADFTDNLDMGWNCFGIPYLVSDYKPYETATTAAHGEANNGKYMMDTPHTLWLYYSGKYADGSDFDGKPEVGDGGYYSVKSWESGVWTGETTNPWHVSNQADERLWVGEGIFTQTAAIDDTESLVFYRPVAPAMPVTAKRTNSRFYSVTGITEIEKDEPLPGEEPSGESVNVVETKYYTVDGMQIERPRRGVVIIRQKLSNGKTRSIKRNYK